MTSIGLAERTDLLGYPCSSLKQILSCTPPASLARRARFSLCELAGYSPPRSAAQRFSTTFVAKRRFEPGPPRQPTGTAFARRTAPGRTAATARPIASTGAAGASHDGVGLLTPTLLPRRERAYYTRPTVASGVDDKRASRRRRGVGRPRRAESVPKEHSGLVCPLRRAGERASGAWQQRELRWWRTGRLAAQTSAQTRHSSGAVQMLVPTPEAVGACGHRPYAVDVGRAAESGHWSHSSVWDSDFWAGCGSKQPLAVIRSVRRRLRPVTALVARKPR
jgi:hypothetical protein